MGFNYGDKMNQLSRKQYLDLPELTLTGFNLGEPQYIHNKLVPLVCASVKIKDECFFKLKPKFRIAKNKAEIKLVKVEGYDKSYILIHDARLKGDCGGWKVKDSNVYGGYIEMNSKEFYMEY